MMFFGNTNIVLNGVNIVYSGYSVYSIYIVYSGNINGGYSVNICTFCSLQLVCLITTISRNTVF